MPEIDAQKDQHGGRSEGRDSGTATDREIQVGLVADEAELRTQFAALLAKLDADTGVTDTDYASTLTPAAQTVTVGT